MIFDQTCSQNANKNILLAGVGVTALPSLNVAVGNNYAGSHSSLKVAIMPGHFIDNIYRYLFCQEKTLPGTSCTASTSSIPFQNFRTCIDK